MDAELMVVLLGGLASITFWVVVRVVLKARQEKRTGTDEQRAYLDHELQKHGLNLVPGETLDSGLCRLEKARVFTEQYNRVVITHSGREHGNG